MILNWRKKGVGWIPRNSISDPRSDHYYIRDAKYYFLLWRIDLYKIWLHMGGNLWGVPLVTIPHLRIFWSSLYKLQFLKSSHVLHEQKFHPLLPTNGNGGRPQISGIGLWQVTDHQKKPVCTFLPVSPVGEQIGGKKIGGLIFSAIVKL
jgi:hypothetical protein